MQRLARTLIRLVQAVELTLRGLSGIFPAARLSPPHDLEVALRQSSDVRLRHGFDPRFVQGRQLRIGIEEWPERILELTLVDVPLLPLGLHRTHASIELCKAPRLEQCLGRHIRCFARERRAGNSDTERQRKHPARQPRAAGFHWHRFLPTKFIVLMPTRHYGLMQPSPEAEVRNRAAPPHGTQCSPYVVDSSEISNESRLAASGRCSLTAPGC